MAIVFSGLSRGKKAGRKKSRGAGCGTLTVPPSSCLLAVGRSGVNMPMPLVKWSLSMAAGGERSARAISRLYLAHTHFRDGNAAASLGSGS